MSNFDKNWKNNVLTAEEDESIVYEGRRVPVSDVNVGDEIITKWTRTGKVAKGGSFKVKFKNPCPGNNGLHVHINVSNCYDSRAFVYVK